MNCRCGNDGYLYAFKLDTTLIDDHGITQEVRIQQVCETSTTVVDYYIYYSA